MSTDKIRNCLLAASSKEYCFYVCSVNHIHIFVSFLEFEFAKHLSTLFIFEKTSFPKKMPLYPFDKNRSSVIWHFVQHLCKHIFVVAVCFSKIYRYFLILWINLGFVQYSIDRILVNSLTLLLIDHRLKSTLIMLSRVPIINWVMW
jgi:hypothetical protein